MKTKQTVVNQLLPLIPDGDEIMDYICANNADARMLDDWLYQRMFKDRDWEQMEKEQMEHAHKVGGAMANIPSEFRLDFERYYNETYNQQDDEK
jgi:hypothetical protein